MYKYYDVKRGERIFYLDVIRTVACFAIVMIHSSARYVIMDVGTVDFWIGDVLDSFSRVGVPLFVMISGALLLDNNYECTSNKIIKHIKKMTIFLWFTHFYMMFITILLCHYFRIYQLI